MKNKWICLCIAVLTSGSLLAQGLRVGAEFQAYPTGYLPGVRIAYDFAQKHSVHTRLGYNVVRHRDLGVHEDERGGGFGFTLGYDHFFGKDFKGFFAGARMDLWFNEVDWKDFIGTPAELAGTSNVTVWQPTLEAGYLFNLPKNLFVSPTLAFGLEVNVKTDGAEVGEGLIGLLGFVFGYRIN